MERITDINFDRILWCCNDASISVELLAAELEIAPNSLARDIVGERGLTYGQLKKIAAFFGRGVLFFLEPGPVQADRIHSPQFRTLQGQKPHIGHELKKLIERVEDHRQIYLSLLDELREERPPFDPPPLNRRNPVDYAAVARQWLQLGPVNDFDSYRRAVEDKGILVFKTQGYLGKWRIAPESPIQGFSLYSESCPVIVVRKQRAESMEAFTLAHELAHLLIHRQSSIDDTADFFEHPDAHERQANLFAGHFLVPDRFLEQIDLQQEPEEISHYEDWLAAHRRQWGVSSDVIIIRLMETGAIGQHRYTEYRRWQESRATDQNQDGGSRGYRHREPIHIFGRKFVGTVLDALNERYIPITKASKFLDGLKLTDLHKLERYYAGP